MSILRKKTYLDHYLYNVQVRFRPKILIIYHDCTRNERHKPFRNPTQPQKIISQFVRSKTTIFNRTGVTIGKRWNSSLIHTIPRQFIIIGQCPLIPRYCRNIKSSADDTYTHMWSSHDPSAAAAAAAAVVRNARQCTLGHALHLASV